MDEAEQERWVERLAEFAAGPEAKECILILETTGRRPPAEKENAHAGGGGIHPAL